MSGSLILSTFALGWGFSCFSTSYDDFFKDIAQTSLCLFEPADIFIVSVSVNRYFYCVCFNQQIFPCFSEQIFTLCLFYFHSTDIYIVSVSVNRYELLALEQLHQGLTEERMVLAFQALDELIPKLGVYSRLFSKLRDDFFS